MASSSKRLAQQASPKRGKTLEELVTRGQADVLLAAIGKHLNCVPMVCPLVITDKPVKMAGGYMGCAYRPLCRELARIAGKEK